MLVRRLVFLFNPNRLFPTSEHHECVLDGNCFLLVHHLEACYPLTGSIFQPSLVKTFLGSLLIGFVFALLLANLCIEAGKPFEIRQFRLGSRLSESIRLIVGWRVLLAPVEQLKSRSFLICRVVWHYTRVHPGHLGGAGAKMSSEILVCLG